MRRDGGDAVRAGAACIACGTAGTRDERSEALLALSRAPVAVRVWRCARCHMRWLDPFPVPGVEIYDEKYYTKPVSDGPAYTSQQDELEPCYREIAEAFAAHGAGSVLDVGCGMGDCMLAMRRAGLEPVGIEMSSFAADAARSRGLEVHEGPAEVVGSRLLGEGRTFEAIHCSHVLEHTGDARGFLALLHRLLRPGGLLYLEVPNQFRNVLEKIDLVRGKDPAFSVLSVHHHYFFSRQSLLLLLQGSGFTVRSMRTFRPCRRRARKGRLKRWALQSMLFAADVAGGRGDVISVWAARGS